MDIICQQIKGHEAEVLVVVSNNNSTDNTFKYLESLKFPWLMKQHNFKNIGGAANIAKCYSLPVQSKFIWPIGDDDYLMPGAISGILELIEKFPTADYIFCNTKAFPVEQSLDIMKAYNTTGLVEGGNVKSNKYIGTDIVDFGSLIDPAIADTLLGELMCNCFRQSAVKLHDDGKINWNFEEFNFEKVDIESIGNHCQVHNLAFLQSFKISTKSVYCDTVRTFNFWGSAEWLNEYDFVFPIIILYLIKQYKARGFISNEKFFELLNYYYLVMKNSLTRQVEGTSKARPFSDSIKAEMFETAILHMNHKSVLAG